MKTGDPGPIDFLRRRPGQGHVADSGYVYMQDGGRFRLQHRVVMERILGRPLHEDETIHHINGVRSDNRPENLELWVGAPRRGIRIEDALDWAREILRRYDREAGASTQR
jgi:hypothetical protein